MKYEAFYLVIQVQPFLHVKACTPLNFCTWPTHIRRQQLQLGADSLFMGSKSDTFALEMELRQQVTKTSQSDAFPKCPCVHMVTRLNDNMKPAHIEDEITGLTFSKAF